MTQPLISSGSDGVHSLDAHNSSKLNTVLANNDCVETTMHDGSTYELECALPLRQGFAPGNMCIAELADQCLREVNHYNSGVLHSESYCAELFHRAILQEDQDAWQAVQQCLSETVRGWLDRHPKREVACRLNSEENYIAQTFSRFYQAAILRQVELSQLSSAMLYLRMSLNSAILDVLRASSRPRKLSELDTSTIAHKVWEMLEKMSLNEREQRMAYLLFHCGLGSKDIVRTFPEEFNDEREIALLRYTIIGRLLDDVDQRNGTIDTSRNVNSTKVRAWLVRGEREE